AIVTTHDLETIPLAARSFANIAYLAPGTEPVEPSDPTKARITAVSSGGSSGLNMEISIDGADNSDDYIGGFLQNVSPDAIQEFAVRTAQENADTSRTTGASVVLSTKRGTDAFHGDEAFYGRASALNARFPIENPAPNPKQPFSRQNYVSTLGGPLMPGKAWFFASLEAVNEHASIAYSPANQAQFAALAQLASDGLIPGVTSIPVPNSVGVPFRDYLGLLRLDWAQNNRSQWLLRTGVDNYTTENAFVQQGALPSTGATSHNNYLNLVLSNQFAIRPDWLASTLFGAGGLHLTEARNSQLGFALAFPFTATSNTVSGLETFGDNQFITAITAFPVLRNQEKYQFRFDVRHDSGRHASTVGINFIHEPVMGGALAATQESLVSFPQDPIDYLANPAQFTADYAAGSSITPAGDGNFSQNVQRLGVYAEDVWRVTPQINLSYGLRWDTTYGLFMASGRSQATNPALLTLRALSIPLIDGIPHDYRGQVAPRLGLVYSPDSLPNTVFRAGFGLFYNDLAQNGWVSAFQAVNSANSGPCVNPGDSGCVPSGAVIDPKYKTPYAIHVTGGMQHAFNSHWMLSADYIHQQGNHAYRRYQYQAGSTLFSPLFPPDIADQQANVPNITVFRSDNRSSYNAFLIHLQGELGDRLNFVANYTFSKAQTYGCILGELFDYVNGVCNPLRPFEKGDYGPSGEDVPHRLVLAGTMRLPGGLVASTITQAESARPFTLTTATNDNRAVVNGKQLSLDDLRGTPYIQSDIRFTRPISFHDRWSLAPFVELFNIFNRNNPGANYVTNIAALPVPQSELQGGNVTDVCGNADCSSLTPITSLNQLRVPAGALGDFFGPGTTVGIPFAAQIGVRASF
ncbi:MAG TPA: TonB-dependent receptor, partial [Acidisarcina sp.]